MSRSTSRLAARSSGFTLVEVLTVIAIISVLAGLTFASVNVARKFSDRKACQQEIQMLVAGIERYNVEHGDYPPTSLTALKVKVNPINDGNETLVLCLSSKKKGGPYHEPFKEGRLQNRDKDKLATKDFVTLKRDLDFSQGTEELFEYLDLWDNPFVYIHNRDYDKKLEYLDGEGSRVTVKAAKSAKLGAYQSPTSFQIWSFGPNKINENGEGDDIASWK